MYLCIQALFCFGVETGPFLRDGQKPFAVMSRT